MNETPYYGPASRIFSVEGKKAVVTGGSRGLGREMALCLLENGCDVFLLARNPAPCAQVEAYARSIGRECRSLACDVTKSEDVAAAVDAALAAMGRIDILINAAGSNILHFLEDMDDGSWDTVVRTNLTSVFLMTRETVRRAMRPQRYGKIISLSSVKAFLGTALTGHSAYCAAKAGVTMLTKQLACETAADGITVNAIAPTFIKTDINAALLEDPSFRGPLVKRIPVGRIGEFRDLCGLTLLLASDASQFITGQTLMLDGGLTARQE